MAQASAGTRIEGRGHDDGLAQRIERSTMSPLRSTGVLAQGHDRIQAAVHELMLPALLLRSPGLIAPETVHIYVPHGPTVAFSVRDLRSPGIAVAVRAARDAGFQTVVRSAGGRMVAYDSGSVVIDDVTLAGGLGGLGTRFSENAEAHVAVLERLGVTDVRVGEVSGEYCPGEFSVNVAGRAKVIGSAQRVTGTGALFSTIVQVRVSTQVRAVIEAVSGALGYELRATSIAGLADFVPDLSPQDVAEAFADDYRRRRGLGDGQLPDNLVAHALQAGPGVEPTTPFRVDDWVRAHPVADQGHSLLRTTRPARCRNGSVGA